MKTWTDYPQPVAAMLAVLLTLAACGDAAPLPDADAGPTEAPEVAAALDWAEATGMEFGAAPFSPPGWPYRVGDEIDEETLRQLHKRFPGFLTAYEVVWVDGLAFGAVYDHDAGTKDYSAIYLGHFPKKVDRDFYEGERRYGDPFPVLPPGGNVEKALGDRFEQSAGAVLDSLDVLRSRWHGPFQDRYGGGGKR